MALFFIACDTLRVNMAYTTVTNIANKIGKTLTTAQTDYLNDVAIPAIERYIDQQTYTTFEKTTPTDTYVSGDGSSILVIPTMHNITAVSVFDEGDTETSVADYSKYPRGGADSYALRATNGKWNEGFENYKVTGVLGYTSVPDDIVMVATELAVDALGSNDSAYKSEKVGDWAVTYKDDTSALTDESRSVLASYKRLSRSV